MRLLTSPSITLRAYITKGHQLARWPARNTIATCSQVANKVPKSSFRQHSAYIDAYVRCIESTQKDLID